MIRAESISVEFKSSGSPKKLGALNDVSFFIKEGEFVSLIGPSGCGKSSLINVMAGLIPVTGGEIFYKDKLIANASRERVVIFQNHSLFPWKTARENIEFALLARKIPAKEIKKLSDYYLKLVTLEEFGGHYPQELSGGMQQRIGIARALAADPEVLLLDEPFASLDQFTRDRVQEELLNIIRPLKKTAVLVTHNLNEAIYFADRVFVMSGRPGTIREIVNIDIAKPKKFDDIDDNTEFQKIKKTIRSILNKMENEHD